MCTRHVLVAQGTIKISISYTSSLTGYWHVTQGIQVALPFGWFIFTSLCHVRVTPILWTFIDYPIKVVLPQVQTTKSGTCRLLLTRFESFGIRTAITEMNAWVVTQTISLRPIRWIADTAHLFQITNLELSKRWSFGHLSRALPFSTHWSIKIKEKMTFSEKSNVTNLINTASILG